MKNVYKNYFAIDENYYSSVSAELIAGGFVDWRSFYPHDSFVRLLRDTANVLDRKQKKSLWVEGAYGTGKSHAVLTLKKLLDADENSTKEYFLDNELDMDLFEKIQSKKNQNTILTIHRVGSSKIRNDNALIMAIQESIKAEIKNRGLEFSCENTLKDSIVKWLSDDINAINFDNYIEGRYKLEFGDETASTIVEKLNKYSDNEISELIRKIFSLAEEEGITPLYMDVKDLCNWIKELIDKNGIKIIFIWDEFTEYFQKNENSISGFQTLCELSETSPFHFVIVTHKSNALFDERDPSRKIIDRFVTPCEITLPDNMAFKLVAKAMKIKNDDEIKKDWRLISDDLYNQLSRVNNIILNFINSKDENDVKRILPIHPYAMVILTHLSAMYSSNQRSMFEFIKDKKSDDDDSGFIWVIENFGPYDDEKLLTIDMLWKFFYENGKTNIKSSLKSILCVYEINDSKNRLTYEQQRVLKTILLLQGVSENSQNSVDLFKTTATNIRYAFEGTDIAGDKSIQIADSLVKSGILYKQPSGTKEKRYLAMRAGGDAENIKNNIEDLRKDNRTKDLLKTSDIEEILQLTGAYKLRYEVEAVTVDDITKTLNRIEQSNYENRIPLIFSFAKNSKERAIIYPKIIERCKVIKQDIVFVDTTLSDLRDDDYEEYIENLARSKEWLKRDAKQARQYEGFALDILKKWKQRIMRDEIRVITKHEECKYQGVDEVIVALQKYNSNVFPMSLESSLKTTTGVYDQTSFNMGAKCGMLEETKSRFSSSNKATKLENALEGLWRLPKGVEPDRTHLVYRIKMQVDKSIEEHFKKNDRVSIYDIYLEFKSKPYGFIPCGLTAFILGFVLKDYVDERYRWSNSQISETLSHDKLAQMIENALKEDMHSSPRYVHEYIIRMTKEERTFLHQTAFLFGINEQTIDSVESAVTKITGIVGKRFEQPLWSTEVYLNNAKPENFNKTADIIGLYCTLLNNTSSNNDIEIANKIGKRALENPELFEELKKYFSIDIMEKGMRYYLKNYREGLLLDLANQINSSNLVLKHLGAKIKNDSTWLWKKETVNEQIDNIITEYQVVCESNKIISSTNSFKECILQWREKIRPFKVSYSSIKALNERMPKLLDSMYSVINNNVCAENFLLELKSSEDSLNSIFDKQVDWFKTIFKFDLHNLTDIDIQAILSKIPYNSFGLSKYEYNTKVIDIITEYKKNKLRLKIEQLWKTKTNTDSPKDWSKINVVPVLCILDEQLSDFNDTREAIQTVSNKSASDNTIKKALACLRDSNVFDRLDNKGIVEKCFIDKVIGSKNFLIINDINLAKQELKERVPDVYAWYPKSYIMQSIIDDLATKQYQMKGYVKVADKINSMTEDALKEYLLKLAENNKDVGIAILEE